MKDIFLNDDIGKTINRLKEEGYKDLWVFINTIYSYKGKEKGSTTLWFMYENEADGLRWVQMCKDTLRKRQGYVEADVSKYNNGPNVTVSQTAYSYIESGGSRIISKFEWYKVV